jgi:hypothetical protein
MTRPLFVCASLALLLAAPVTVAGDEVYRGEDHMMVTPQQLHWQPVASMGEGARIAFIEGDLSASEPFTFRLRLEDGYRILPHTHPAFERVTVLQGTLHFAHGREFDPDAARALPVGSVAIMPAGHPMFGYAEGETIIQLHGTGPWGI